MEDRTEEQIIDLVRRGKGETVISYLLWREKIKNRKIY